MNRHIIKALIILMMSLGLTGCWNYVGLNEMTITTGFAIDKNSDTNQYHLTFEIVDLAATGKERIITPKLIEADGETIFEAVRNAKKRINNKLYFGNAKTVVISEQIAKTEGIFEITDWLLRDAEPRETLSLIISQEKTAKEILEQKGLGNPLTLIEINGIVKKDQKTTATTKYTQLYKIYSILKKPGQSLTLSAFHRVENDDKLISEANGVGVFKKDKLIGYLSPEETKYYLFAINEIKGGVISIKAQSNEGEHNVTFEIFKSNTISSYTYKNNKIKVKLKPNLKVSINEDEGHNKNFDEKAIDQITSDLEEALSKNIENVIKKVQTEFDSDIFGFGEKIYKSNPKLWEKLSKNWDDLFPAIEIDVKPNVTIINTAYTK